MNIRKATLLFLTLMSLCGSIAADASGWSTQDRLWAKHLDQSHDRFESGNVATVWGAVRRRFDSLLQNTPDDVLLPASGFTQGRLPVTILLQQKEGKTVPAPLAVFLTGIFGTNQDPVARTMIQLLHESGYHVLALNNPWSANYRSAGPLGPPGKLEAEARVVLQLITNARSHIGESLIESTRLVGVSYGGFLAHVVLALDSRAPRSLIDAGLLAFSPPMDFRYALAQMDIGIARARMLSENCEGWHKAGDVLSYLFRDSEDSLSSRTIRCADYLLFSDFIEKLRHTTGKMMEEKGWQSAWDSVDLKRELNFRTFQKGITHVSVEAVSVNTDPELKLGYWLERLRNAHRTDAIQILSAEDDFVNAPNAWHSPEISGLLRPKSLLLLRWGGHFGYTPRPEFVQIVKSALNFAH